MDNEQQREEEEEVAVPKKKAKKQKVQVALPSSHRGRHTRLVCIIFIHSYRERRPHT